MTQKYQLWSKFLVTLPLLFSIAGCSPAGSPPQKPLASLPSTQKNSLGMEFQLVLPGEFQRIRIDERGGLTGGRYQIQVSQPFYMARHEVTRGQFRAFVEATGYLTDAETEEVRGGIGIQYGQPARDPKFTWRETGFEQDDRHPVVNVSWNDAQAFVEWLAEKEGRRYRLPTEAEWELACRAGTETYFSSGNDPEQLAQIANIADAAFAEQFSGMTGTIRARDGHTFTAPVGSFQPNSLGFYDLHGNVAEWCYDWWSPESWAAATDPAGPEKGSFKPIRGGSWASFPGQSTSGLRQFVAPNLRDYSIGFRVALEPEL